MQETHYFCDKCKKEVGKADGLSDIEIKSGHHYSGRSIWIRYSLCVDCEEKIGIIKKVVKADKIVPEPQDIKDRLFDIVAELVAECCQTNI